MYGFKGSNSSNEILLHNGEKIPAFISRNLLDFQLEALCFCYKSLSEHDFVVLNDATGLGKTAVACMLLRLIATDKKTVIILPNDKTLLLNWLFHLDVLTDFRVQYIMGALYSVDNNCQIYLICSNVLYEDFNKFVHFNIDYVLVDNRGLKPLLCEITSLCIPKLNGLNLSINIIISSIDITLNEQMTFSAMLLGDVLPIKYYQYNIFHGKYKLLSNYFHTGLNEIEQFLQSHDRLKALTCSYRIRRYCHNFKNDLPLRALVENQSTWRLNLLKLVRRTRDSNSTEEVIYMSPLVFEYDTEIITIKDTDDDMSITNSDDNNNSQNSCEFSKKTTQTSKKHKQKKSKMKRKLQNNNRGTLPVLHCTNGNAAKLKKTNSLPEQEKRPINCTEINRSEELFSVVDSADIASLPCAQRLSLTNSADSNKTVADTGLKELAKDVKSCGLNSVVHSSFNAGNSRNVAARATRNQVKIKSMLQQPHTRRVCVVLRRLKIA